MYYHSETYNGVLFLLREPHTDKKDQNLPVEEIINKSNEWVCKMLNGSSYNSDWKRTDKANFENHWDKSEGITEYRI